MSNFLRIRKSLSSKTLLPSTFMFSLLAAHVPRSFRIERQRKRPFRLFGVILGGRCRSFRVVLAGSGLSGVVTYFTNDGI